MVNGKWHGGVEQEIQALGQTWRLSRRTRHVWREFSEWGRTVLPDPIQAIARHIADVALADDKVMREMMRRDKEDAIKGGLKAVAIAPLYVQLAETTAAKALDKAASYLSFGSPELSSLLYSPEGQVKMLHLLLKKHHPDVTEDTADEIANEIGPHRLGELFQLAGGYVPAPEKNDEAPAAQPSSPGAEAAA